MKKIVSKEKKQIVLKKEAIVRLSWNQLKNIKGGIPRETQSNKTSSKQSAGCPPMITEDCGFTAANC